MITYRLKRFSVSGEYVESSESSVKTINNGKVHYKRLRKHKSGETFTTPEGDVVMVDYPEHKNIKKGSYRLKRYSDDGEKKESHTLRNGLLAAGAITAGVMAGRAGMLGAGVQRGIGQATAWTGQKLGNMGMNKIGTSLVKDGAMTKGKGAATLAMNNAASKGVTGDALKKIGENAAKTSENRVLNNFAINPSTPA